MSNNTPETSTIDRLFLELSQFTKAKTNAQITLEYKLSEAEKTIDRLCDEFNNENGQMHMGEPVIKNPFMDKLAAVTAQRDELLLRLSFMDKLAAVTAQRDELLLRLSSMVGTMRTLCLECGWSTLDFPDVEKAESLIDNCEQK